MMKQFDKWKKKSLFSKLVDIFLVLFVVAMLIPASRTIILTGVNNLKSKIIPPKSAKKAEIFLSTSDYNWQLVDMQGNIVHLFDFKEKVIFINFWATWCGPCIGEMPELQSFYEKYKNNDKIAFIFASSDDLQTIQAFMRKKQYTFPVYRINMQLPPTLDHSSIPTSFVINKFGGIVIRQRGVANWNSNKMDNTIEKLLE